jgi:hypothetical protein
MIRHGLKRPNISSGTRLKIAKATFRAAGAAAERGLCDLADLMIMRARVDPMTAARKVRNPRSAVKWLDGGIEAAEAAERVSECRTRKRAGEPQEG